jgi:hypothetical protein
MTEGLPQAIVNASLGRQVIHRQAEPAGISSWSRMIAGHRATQRSRRQTGVPTGCLRARWDGPRRDLRMTRSANRCPSRDTSVRRSRHQHCAGRARDVIERRSSDAS